MTVGEERAAVVGRPISMLGGGFMLSDHAKALGKEIGAGGWGTYMIGRGGVLGDVDPAVVEAAMWFFPPDRVETSWRRARALIEPAAGASAFAGICAAWGRERLAGVADLDRLAALLETVARATPPAGAPLFAGWRALPLPDDAPGRVLQLCMVLREYRGAMNGVATAAAGLSPLQAVLLNGGPGNAAFLGWAEPYPDVSELKDLREQSEAVTNRLCGPPWGTLADAEFEECRGLLTAAAAAAFPGA